MRANKTLKIIKDVLNDKKVFNRAWQLNERHYGSLTGLNKVEMVKKLGEKRFMNFEDLGTLNQKGLNKESPYHPINIDTYKDIKKK